MQKKHYLLIVGLTVISSLCFSTAFYYFTRNDSSSTYYSGDIPANYTSYLQEKQSALPVDFTFAAKATVEAVVHITIKTKERIVQRDSRTNPSIDDFFDDFFDQNPQQRHNKRSDVLPEQKASGSGVIVSDDGYIITNNHVVEDADEIKVTLNNKKQYTAKLIGRDPNSDLAVLKIDDKKLPYVLYGNSNNVELGQWVLAIGYPLFLDVTVTAGIVSAKARSLGLNAANPSANYSVESYIQTDAAVNKGNSGGPLVNLKGELIGINSAIASPTGYYSGYSYAIPVNIVRKIVTDIIKTGVVQRAFLGISYPSKDVLNEELTKKYPKYSQGAGVLVIDVASDGAAKIAGIKEGDIITKIGARKITSGPELVEEVANYKPSDKLDITYLREGKEYKITVTLLSKSGSYASIRFSALGVEMADLTKKQAEEYRIKGGVEIKKINEGLISRQTRMKPGFVITKIENQEVTSVETLKNILNVSENIIQVQGFYPNYEGTFFFQLDLTSKNK